MENLNKEAEEYAKNEWQEHPIFKNYWANALGNIKTTNYKKKGQEKYIKQTKRKNGYTTIYVGKLQYCHRFVYECFKGIIPDKLEIHHKNHNPSDNSIANLELISQNLNKLKRNLTKKRNPTRRYL